MNIQENFKNFEPTQELQIIKTGNIQDIQKLVSKLENNATVFLDIDDTIITPASNIFRAHSPFRNYIDDLKQNKHAIPNFEKILSEWRKKRQSILVAKEWPEIIQNLHQRKVITYALTQMAGGKLGDMTNVEEWRYQELLSKGIRFSPTFNQKETQIILSDHNDSLRAPAIFHRGFFLTGSFSKGQVMKNYFDVHRPAQVLFVDDREAQVQDVCQACKESAVPFIGIIYQGAETLPGNPDPAVVQVQIQKLMENIEWLEDGDAEKLLGK